MGNEIEIKLFDFLQTVADLLNQAEKIDTESKDELTIIYHKVENNLETFIENFFFQVFNNGFGIQIEGFTDEDFSLIEDGFNKSDELPENMIECFKAGKSVIRDIAVAVYLDPPRKSDLYKAYLGFLPKVFESFKKDKHVLDKKISNYGKLVVKMEGIVNWMDNFKKQSKLI